MTDWTFHNITHGTSPVLVESADHAVELLLGVPTVDGYGVIVEYLHAKSGLICCTTNTVVSSLMFNPDYRADAHSLRGSRTAFRVQPALRTPFYFVGNTQTVSSIPARYLLPIKKVVKAVRYLIERHELTPAVRWSELLPE